MGCTDTLACNYDSLATDDDSSCTYAETNYDCNGDCLNDTDGDGVCDELEVVGCADETACNYDSIATDEDNSSCEYADEFYDCDSNCLNDANGDLICDEFELQGCTDPNASNYDSNATDDDGSCEYNCSLPISWEYELTGLNHTMMIPEDVLIDVYGEPLTHGSTIGVFYSDENGQLECVGHTQINGQDTFIAIMGDDSTTDEIDGMVEGQEMIWLVWDVLTCAQYQVNPSYTSGPSTFTINGLTVLESLEHFSCQQIELSGGWFMFSTYIQADDTDAVIITSPLGDNLIIVKNNDGQVYLPEYDFNGIGDLDVKQGYQIKTNTSSTLEICGLKLQPEANPIALQPGWNLIPYLREQPSPTDLVFEDINENGNLLFVKDYNGNPYFPEWDFNGIGDMLPGQGYQVNVTNTETLNYYSNNQEYRISTNRVIENKVDYFDKVIPTGNNMQVVIPEFAWSFSPDIGAEIAAFTSDGILVGSAKYSQPITVLTLWGDDEMTKTIDGLLSGEPVVFKVWDKEQISDYKIENWSAGSNAYQIDAINVAASIEIEDFILATNLFDAIPNPSQTKTNISFFIAETQRVNVSVYNVVGELVEVLANSVYNPGTHHLEMQVSNIEAGSYFYTMRAGDFEKTKQLIILK